MRRPSASLVIACAALAVATAGTAEASGLINGASISDGSITGRKLATNSVGGAKIKESTLVGVNAARVAGLRPFAKHATLTAGSATTTLARFAGVGRLTIGCTNTSPAKVALQLKATNHLTIYGVEMYGSSGQPADILGATQDVQAHFTGIFTLGDQNLSGHFLVIAGRERVVLDLSGAAGGPICDFVATGMTNAVVG